MCVCRSINESETSAHNPVSLSQTNPLDPLSCSQGTIRRTMNIMGILSAVKTLIYSFMHAHAEAPACPLDAFPVLKCDASAPRPSDNTRTGSEGYEVYRNNAGRAAGPVEQRLLQLRLRWAIRRIHQGLIIPLQRKCELKMFVVLRLQYLYRRRNRIRAAITIQKFVRHRILLD
jgi:hypothetical protein